MSINNTSALNMAIPAYEVDKIIGVFTDTVAISAPTSGGGTTTVTKTYAHGFGDSAYFQGIFTSDGGSTYNDFGAQTPRLTTPSQPVLQTLDCNAWVDTTNLNVRLVNYYDYVNSLGVAYTVTYKVYLLAKNTMSLAITPSGNFIPSNKLRYASKYNYQKIVKQGSLSLSVGAGSTGSVSATHDLGYIPNVRAYWFDSGTPTTCRAISYSPGQGGIAVGPDSVQVEATNTQVTFYSDQGGFFGVGCSGVIEYRIYL